MTALRTDELIGILVSQMRPVRPLRPPARRVAAWVALSLPWLALVVFIMGRRPDLHARLVDGRWLTELAAAAATAITAAHAALSAGIPGRGRRWERFVPLAFMALWLGLLGRGCIVTSRIHGAAGFVLRSDWHCLPAVVAVGFVPGLIIARMILRGVPLAPTSTAALGALATAAMGDLGLQLFHQVDSSLMVLIWQGGAVIGLTLLGASLGPRLLRWRLDIP